MTTQIPYSLADSNLPQGVRQTVQYSSVDANGLPNFVTAAAGGGLNADLNASAAKPVVVSFSAGPDEYRARISAAVANAWANLPANNLSFGFIERNATTGAISYSSTLAPRQEANVYNQAAQSVLQFGGAAGSTTFLDDFGNVWTPMGGAKVQTNQVKFGTGALGGAGANNALNGTSDGVKTTAITTLGQGGWALRCWFYPTTVASAQGLMVAGNASYYGVQIGYSASAKMNYWLSSTGSSNDIASGGAGSITLTANAMHYFEITYDPVAGKYFGYVDGQLDYSVASTAKICGITQLLLGMYNGTVGLPGYIDKFEFLPYCQHPNGTAYAVPTAAPNVASAGYASDFFSVPNMTMYSVSGPSTAAGANPSYTQKQRVYVAEVTTNGTGIASMVNYALNGVYDSGWFNTGSAARLSYVKNHNLGVAPIDVKLYGAADAAGTNMGFPNPGYIVWSGTALSGSFFAANITRNTATFQGDDNPRYVSTASGEVPLAYGRMICRRGYGGA